mgnify:FL=1|jgi:hypothetical protein
MKDAIITLLFGLLTALVLPFVAFRYHKLFTILGFISDWPPKRYEYTPCEDNEVIDELAQEVVEAEELPQELTDKSVIDDAISGLVSVGFKKREATAAVKRATLDVKFEDVKKLIIAALNRSNT